MDMRYASRKFILAAFVVLAGLCLLVFKVIDQETWASLTTWVLGLYFTGNVGSYLVSKVTPATKVTP